MRLTTVLCAATLFVGPAPAIAEEPIEWLLKVSDAARDVSYQGVVVYRDGERMDVMRIVHRQQNGRSQERLTSLNGQARDILRDGDRVYFLAGDMPAQAAGADPLFPVMSQQLLTQATAHYDYRHLGESRVAGRVCRGVLMSPRDDYRYGYEICGDAGTGVPLRVSLVDRGGRTVEQLMFTEIAFPAKIADSAFTPPPGAVAPTVLAVPAAQQAVPETWRLATLPPGFHVVRRDLAPAPDGVGVAERVLLSDGVSAISVFGMQPVASARVLTGLFNLGAMSAYGRSIGAFHITVIGDVPPDTVRMIGDGFAAPVEAAIQPARLTD
jgi:sigma-E factor negative regulatory protein RseB